MSCGGCLFVVEAPPSQALQDASSRVWPAGRERLVAVLSPGMGLAAKAPSGALCNQAGLSSCAAGLGGRSLAPSLLLGSANALQRVLRAPGLGVGQSHVEAVHSYRPPWLCRASYMC